ncbi:MAG: hypothetical protein M1827_003757 [Pycnora praestabilis]|nr:MAG: hypothetical protein M1827_003757 [Pycnora praestabilis]
MTEHHVRRLSKESVSGFKLEPLLEPLLEDEGSEDDLREKDCSRSRRETVSQWLWRHAFPFEYRASESLSNSFNFIFPALAFLIPSFLVRLIPTLKLTKQSANLRGVAALDGVRGFASLGVFILHFTDTFCSHRVNRGFGFDADDRWWFQLPFVRVFWTGPAMVSCFFIISGYVLSYKPLKHMRSRSDAPLLNALSSAIFRRGLRLYLPIVVATFIAMLLVRIGAYSYAHEVYNDGVSMTATEDTPTYQPTFGAQLAHWWSTCLDMMYPWHFGSSGTEYDPHLWTIPIEFQGSMVLYLVMLLTSGLRPSVRLVVGTLLIAYCLWSAQLDYMEFSIGMVLAEVDIILLTDIPSPPALELSSPATFSSTLTLTRYKSYILLPLFILGWHMMGTPPWDASSTPGYRTILCVIPNQYYAQKIGCVILIVCVRHCPTILGPLFTNAFAQYLGKISYALYIVHGNVRRTVLYTMMPGIWRLVGGKENQWSFGAAVVLGVLGTWPLTFWLADLFWRGVDMPAVRFARWLEEKCRRTEGEGKP